MMCRVGIEIAIVIYVLILRQNPPSVRIFLLAHGICYEASRPFRRIIKGLKIILTKKDRGGVILEIIQIDGKKYSFINDS